MADTHPAATGPRECWNAWCIAGDCDGVNHYDATGHSWTQQRGYAYNPATGDYDLPEDEVTGIVHTIYER